LKKEGLKLQLLFKDGGEDAMHIIDYMIRLVLMLNQLLLKLQAQAQVILL
jgi:hypothetical protein